MIIDSIDNITVEKCGRDIIITQHESGTDFSIFIESENLHTLIAILQEAENIDTGDGKIDSPFNDFIQNLKCCGNCSHYECLPSAKYTHMCCLLTNETAIHPNWACEEWEYDNISFDRRSC